MEKKKIVPFVISPSRWFSTFFKGASYKSFDNEKYDDSSLSMDPISGDFYVPIEQISTSSTSPTSVSKHSKTTSSIASYVEYNIILNNDLV